MSIRARRERYWPRKRTVDWADLESNPLYSRATNRYPFRCILVVAVRSGEGPFPEPTTASLSGANHSLCSEADKLRRRTAIRSALAGVNAAIVGLLLAALCTPVWTSAIFAPADFAIGIVAFLPLVMWRVPPWLVVVLGAATASIVAVIPG